MSTEVYSLGLTYASACTNESDDAVIAFADVYWPTGLNHGWTISEDATFSGGEPNPSPCTSGREGYRHVLLEC